MHFCKLKHNMGVQGQESLHLSTAPFAKYS